MNSLTALTVVLIVRLSSTDGFEPVYLATLIPAFFFLPFGMVFLLFIFLLVSIFACMCVGSCTEQRKRKITSYIAKINNDKYTDRGVHFREAWPVVGYANRGRKRTEYWLAIDITLPAAAPRVVAEAPPEYPNWVPQAPKI